MVLTKQQKTDLINEIDLAEIQLSNSNNENEYNELAKKYLDLHIKLCIDGTEDEKIEYRKNCLKFFINNINNDITEEQFYSIFDKNLSEANNQLEQEVLEQKDNISNKKSFEKDAAICFKNRYAYKIIYNNKKWYENVRTTWEEVDMSTIIVKIQNEFEQIHKSFLPKKIANDVLISCSGMSEFNKGKKFEFDNDRKFINTYSGIIDVDLGKIVPFDSRVHFCTKSTNCVIAKEIPSDSVWLQQLKDNFGDDEYSLKQFRRAIKSVICGNNEQVFYFIYGPPRTGKSATIKAIINALGEYANSTSHYTFSNKVTGQNFSLAKTKGTRLTAILDTSKSNYWNESLLKTFTGGDGVEAEQKYETIQNFNNYNTLFILGNDYLKFPQTSAIKKRMRIINFKNQITCSSIERRRRERDLDNEKSIILKWCLDCLNDRELDKFDLYKDDDLMSLVLDKYFEIEDYDSNNVEYYVTTSEIYKVAESFFKESGENLKIGDIDKKMSVLGYKRKQIMKTGKRVWVGILNKENKDE